MIIVVKIKDNYYMQVLEKYFDDDNSNGKNNKGNGVKNVCRTIKRN